MKEKSRVCPNEISESFEPLKDISFQRGNSNLNAANAI